ncbi:MAG: hypothetical protein DRN96_08920 [Thermoproteota archaeon]|nr:MAG: hypothetical protein DRN96_08920 [Candidatus Korarchaeota archaeon]RLG51859.1 MAG: hypothetical protein DRN99_08150 [Candidatus Korarchaeota archaeon]
MGKVDLKKVYREYYGVGEEPEVVDLGEGVFLTVEGQGAPGGSVFQRKVKAIYSVAYGVKMALKRRGRDFVVAPLEASWWAEGERQLLEVPREEWRWKLMIRMPDFVSERDVKEAKRRSVGKGVREAEEVRFEKIRVGVCAQALHVGPYSSEGRTIERIMRLLEERGLVACGPHHEVYLSDPRRVPENKLKTIIRYRVESREARSSASS